MTGASPAAAAQTLRDALQRLVSCVSSAVVRVDATTTVQQFKLITALPRATGGRVTLSLLYGFALVSDEARPRSERWQAQNMSYAYALNDADGREIVAYHWHPVGRSPVTVPHLHLGAALGSLRPEAAKAHLHTGVVTPVAVLTLAVERFAVVPRRGDWAAMFAHTLAVFG